jgi:hypothetical protein
MKCDITPARFDIVACGVDTASVSWKPRADDDDWWQMLAGRLRAGWIDHEAGMPVLGVLQRECKMRRAALGGYVSARTVAGGKLMVWPRARRVAVEGRLAALVSGDTDAGGLLAPALIAHAAQLAAAELEWLGVLDGGEPSFVRRLDLATDIEWREVVAGGAVLDGLGRAVPASGYLTSTYAREHGTETVMLFEPSGKQKNLVGRIYDRGDKTGRWQHGQMHRIERELRWQGSESPLVEEVAGSSWTGNALEWVGHLSLRDTVAVALDDQERLLACMELGTVSVETGLRLLGSLVMRQRRDGPAWAGAVGQGAATERKHRRELAALGLPSSAPALLAPDLAAVRAAASSAWDRLPSK